MHKITYTYIHIKMDGLLTHKDAEQQSQNDLQELRNLYNNLTPQEQQEFQLPTPDNFQRRII